MNIWIKDTVFQRTHICRSAGFRYAATICMDSERMEFDFSCVRNCKPRIYRVACGILKYIFPSVIRIRVSILKSIWINTRDLIYAVILRRVIVVNYVLHAPRMEMSQTVIINGWISRNTSASICITSTNCVTKRRGSIRVLICNHSSVPINRLVACISLTNLRRKTCKNFAYFQISHLKYRDKKLLRD